MYVVKRSGKTEPMDFEKIHKRINWLVKEPYVLENVNGTELTQRVIQGLKNNIKTSDIDIYAADLSSSLGTVHLEYITLAGRIAINNHHKNTLNSFKDKVYLLYRKKDKSGNACPVISTNFYKYVLKYQTSIDKYIDYGRDYNLDFFGFKTLEKGYLLHIDDKIIERPQDLFMRVAIQIYMPKDHAHYKDKNALNKIFEVYNMLSQQYYTHATPTLFNAGSPRPQLSSCFEENTYVDTLRGPIKIKDINLGDEVITHLGNVKHVTQIHKNTVGDRDLYKVVIDKTPEMIVTGNHKLWTYDYKNGILGWKEVELLTKYDFIAIPNYSGNFMEEVIDIKDILGENINNKMSIMYEDNVIHIVAKHQQMKNFESDMKNFESDMNRYIKFDKTFMKFLGIWYASGHIIKKYIRGEKEIYGIAVTIHNENRELVDFCMSINEHFGVGRIYKRATVDRKAVRIIFNNKILGVFFEKMFSEGFNKKRLNERLFKYSSEMIYELISGLICVKGRNTKRGNVIFRTKNEIFIKQIYSLCRLHNMDIGPVVKNSINKLSNNQMFDINFTPLKNHLFNVWKEPIIRNKNCRTINGVKFLKVRNITPYNGKLEYVYNLGVDDDHSYSINGIIAKNCFLLGTEDSLEGIMKTLTDSVQISKWSGGVGLHISNWRSEGALIKGTNGKSNGIIPFLRMFNDGARAFNQGGKRNGSFAIYLEMHHPDLMKFLDLKKAHGDENLRCRDLFLALWVSDLFMKRLAQGDQWSFFDPNECPGLSESYGEEYERLYLDYEARGMAYQTINIHDIIESITDSQMEKGIPYILYKDHVNRNSMQKNIGVIKSSNLCVVGETEILTEYGYSPIKELTEARPPIHTIWNGREFTPAIFSKTGENQELMRVVVAISNDMINFDCENEIKCTLYHKFILSGGVEIEAQKLKPGDQLEFWYDPFNKVNNYCEIKSAEKINERADTYCFNEPKIHRGIFNGVLTSQCAEIQLYSDANNYSTCNLMSICLNKFVEDSYTSEEIATGSKRVLNHEFPLNPKMDFKKLAQVAGQMTENLNNVIDKTWCPTIETARSNIQNRPIGIGIQGLADVFMKFRYPFESEEAAALNKIIAEAIYYGALCRSTQLCREYYTHIISKFNKHDININNDKGTELGEGPAEVKVYLYNKDLVKQYPLLKKENVVRIFKNRDEVPKDIGAYHTYHKVNEHGEEAPIKKQFHWELYGLKKDDLCGLFDWETLREHIDIYGVRNSTLTAYMPTASTSQIMGNSSCFEPYMTNLYKRKTLAGYFTVINKYLMNDLMKANLWNNDMKNYLLEHEGSIQELEGIPDEIKNLYKTVWDIKQKTLIDLSADRQPFVDQSQSLNLYVKNYNSDICASIMMYGWKRGVKTGSYYTRVPPALEAQKFTVGVNTAALNLGKFDMNTKKNKINLDDEEEICLLCSS